MYIEYANETLYNSKNSNDWRTIVSYLFAIDMDGSCDDIYKFLEHSADIANSNCYSYQENKDWFNSKTAEWNNKYRYKDTDYIKPLLVKLLNTHQNRYYFHQDDLMIKLKNITDWIVKNTNLDYQYVSNIVSIYDNKSKSAEIKITDTIIYNIKTGNLHTGGRFVLNYFLDGNRSHYKTDNNKYDLIVDDMTDPRFLEVIERFKCKELKNLAIKSSWGSGKTKTIGKPIIEAILAEKENAVISDYLVKIKEDGRDDLYELMNEDENIREALNNIKRCVIISHNNALNKKEFVEISNMENNCLVSHRDINIDEDRRTKLKDKIKKIDDTSSSIYNKLEKQLTNLKHKVSINKSNLNIITSLESIHKIALYNPNSNFGGNKIGVVIIDEIKSIISKIDISKTNDTFKDIDKSLTNFVEILTQADQSLVMDADIDNKHLDELSKATQRQKYYKVKVNATIFNNPTIDPQTETSDVYDFILCEDIAHMERIILNNIQYKLNISTTHKSKGYSLFKKLVIHYHDDNGVIKPEFINEVVMFIGGEGLLLFDCKYNQNCVINKKFINDEDGDSNENENDKFSNIIKINKIQTRQNTELKTLKEEMLNDYENFIIIKNTTKFIRSPTVSVGVSFNSRYFDKTFNYSLSGSVNGFEAIQMFFRERRTTLKEMYFCFDKPSSDYKKMVNDSNIKNKLKNDKTIANTELKDFFSKNQNNNDEDVLYKFKEDNAITNYNHKNHFQQNFLEILHSHNIQYGFNLKVANKYFENIKEMEKDTNNHKQINMERMMKLNVNTMTEDDYFQLEKNINEAEENNIIITDEEKMRHQKYKTFNNYVPSVQHILNKIVVNKDRKELINIIDNNDSDALSDEKKAIVNNNGFWNDLTETINNQITCGVDSSANYIFYKHSEYNTPVHTAFKNICNIHNIQNDEKLKTSLNDDDNSGIIGQYYKSTKYSNADIANLKMTYIIFKALGINIEQNFKSIIVKQFIVGKSDNIDVFSFTELLNKDINIDGNSLTFIEYINKFLKPAYNEYINLNKYFKAKNITKNITTKDLNDIKKILKHYLNKCNLNFDYIIDNVSDTKNSCRLTEKSKFNLVQIYPITTTIEFNQQLKQQIKQSAYDNGVKMESIDEYLARNVFKTPPENRTLYRFNINSTETINDKLVLKPHTAIKNGRGKAYFDIETKTPLLREKFNCYDEPYVKLSTVINEDGYVKVNFKTLPTQKYRYNQKDSVHLLNRNKLLKTLENRPNQILITKPFALHYENYKLVMAEILGDEFKPIICIDKETMYDEVFHNIVQYMKVSNKER